MPCMFILRERSLRDRECDDGLMMCGENEKDVDMVRGDRDASIRPDQVVKCV